MSELIECADIALGECLNLRRYERLLIICDPTCYEIGRAFYDAGEVKCKDTVMVMFQTYKNNFVEQTEFFENILGQFDVVVMPILNSPVNTRINKIAAQKEIRIAALSGITVESFLRTMKTDWRKLGVYTRKMAGKLSSAQKITLTTDAGTNLTFGIGGQHVRADDGCIMSKGTFGDLPAGEAWVVPIEGTAEGIVVIDAAFSLVDGLLEKPLILNIKEGKILKAEGNDCALELEKLFSKNHHSLRTISEIGIGTHDTAILTGNSLEDRKVRGVVRIGIGKVSDDAEQKRLIRLDGILFQPSVWIDDKIFIDRGNHL